MTKVDDRKHLKASRLKPWRDATDAQRLERLERASPVPQIDHLFDQGYISFSSTQQLLIVPEVRDRLLDAWGITVDVALKQRLADRKRGCSIRSRVFLCFHDALALQGCPLKTLTASSMARANNRNWS